MIEGFFFALSISCDLVHVQKSSFTTYFISTVLQQACGVILWAKITNL